MKQTILTFAINGGLALILSAAARALPKPKPDGSPVYGWAYRFAHTLLANWDLRKKK